MTSSDIYKIDKTNGDKLFTVFSLFYTEDGWQRDNLHNIMITNMNKDNSGTPYKLNKFMYYIQVRHSRPLLSCEIFRHIAPVKSVFDSNR